MPIILGVALLGYVIFRFRRRGQSPVRPHLDAGGWVAGADWSTVRPLARAESRRVLRHPAFIVGVVLTPVMLLAATATETHWWGASPSIALALVPLGWF